MSLGHCRWQRQDQIECTCKAVLAVQVVTVLLCGTERILCACGVRLCLPGRVPACMQVHVNKACHKGFHTLVHVTAQEPEVVLQSGVLRTNCIDCLDRTNVAQVCAARVRVPQCSRSSVVMVLLITLAASNVPR